jgi:hypothetical protein
MQIHAGIWLSLAASGAMLAVSLVEPSIGRSEQAAFDDGVVRVKSLYTHRESLERHLHISSRDFGNSRIRASHLEPVQESRAPQPPKVKTIQMKFNGLWNCSRSSARLPIST